MKPNRVRAIAICLFRRGDKILALEGYDEVKRQTFYRPLGGTIEFGEHSSQTVVRELREELSIEAEIGHEISRYEFQYPRRAPILLVFYSVTRYTGEMTNLSFERILWETPERLPGYDFLDGDVDFVRRLARGRL